MNRNAGRNSHVFAPYLRSHFRAARVVGAVCAGGCLSGGRVERSPAARFQRWRAGVRSRRAGKPAVGRPWIWRTEFFGLAPQADIALLDKGFHVACIDIQNMYGAPVALRHMDAFYANLVKQHGLAPKTVLEGFSRGALSALNWATKNPEKVAAIYVRIDGLPGDDWPTNQTVVHLANVHADCLDSVLRAASANVAATLLSNLGHTVVLRVVLAALRQAVRRPACRVRP